MPVGPPKTGGSWWRDLTECGPLEKGMANHFNLIHPIKYLPYFYLFHSHHSRELSIISALNSVYSIHSSTSSYLDLCHYSTKTVAFPIIDDIYNKCLLNSSCGRSTVLGAGGTPVNRSKWGPSSESLLSNRRDLII